MAESLAYPGRELEVFANATRWKRHLRRQLAPFLSGRVLEVGAGIGASTRALCAPPARSWTCLEPDPGLRRRLEAALAAGDWRPAPAVAAGTIRDLPRGASFDAVLYLDVLEHIADDAGELAEAAARLAPGGTLAVVAPAHARLWSPFDKEIGHHRRYDRRSLKALAPPGCQLARCRYLDSAGLLASLANRWLLRRARPTGRQIWFWDRLLVPCSRLLDPLFAYRVGKSVLAVWRINY